MRSRHKREPWGLRVAAIGSPRVRLVWFCHAGGTAATTASGIPTWPEDWEIVIPDYPGRGFGTSVPRNRSLRSLADHFVTVLDEVGSDAPIVLLGHSMGGLVAREYLLRAPHHSTRAVATLIVSAVRAASWFAAERARERPSDDEVIARMLATGGTPREVLEDPGVRALVLSNLRGDLEAIDAYSYDASSPRLDLPIIAFAGLEDPIVSPADMSQWRFETRGEFELRAFNGGHFYHLQAPGTFVEAVREAAEAALGYR